MTEIQPLDRKNIDIPNQYDVGLDAEGYVFNYGSGQICIFETSDYEAFYIHSSQKEHDIYKDIFLINDLDIKKNVLDEFSGSMDLVGMIFIVKVIEYFQNKWFSPGTLTNV